jgi:hypothetical protein
MPIFSVPIVAPSDGPIVLSRLLCDPFYSPLLQLLAYLMPHGGGLLHLAFSLFHQKESIRDSTVDLFNQLRAFPVCERAVSPVDQASLTNAYHLSLFRTGRSLISASFKSLPALLLCPAGSRAREAYGRGTAAVPAAAAAGAATSAILLRCLDLQSHLLDG